MMTLGRKRNLFCLSVLLVIVTSLMLKSSLWLIPNSTGYHYNPSSNLNKYFEHFNAYLGSVQNDIISRLQHIEKSSTDYLIYDCSTYLRGDCGGWNDRITGVINGLLLSLVAKKRFRLIINKPCEIKDYYIPRKINWTVKSDIMSSKNMSHTVFSTGGSKSFYRNMQHNFLAHVNLFRTHWDAMDLYRITENIKKKLPWICNVHHADIYKLIFEVLFKPTDTILRPISELNLDESKKLVCAHIRVGYNVKVRKQISETENRFPLKNISLIFNFLKKFDPDTHYVYIATDSPNLKQLSKKTFSKNFIDIPGKIMHLELDKGKDECEGFTKSLREWWILTKCDVLVLTQSGFGMMAAYLRDNRKPLYCTFAGKLFPCSRYDVIDYYPLDMHIPMYIPISRRYNKTHSYCPRCGLQKAKNLPSFLKGLPE